MVRRSRASAEDALSGARSEVQENLMRLRQYGGLSVENMDSYGAAIRHLPAVTNELRSIEGGRTDAALSVVRCAIANLISDDVNYRLLAATLLFVDKSKTVADRERYSHKHLHELSNNQVEHRRNAAYLDLASRLVSLRQTPCFVKDSSQINQLLLRMELLLEGTERALVGMGVHLEPGFRERSAEYILDQFPRGAAKLAHVESRADRGVRVVRMALSRIGNAPINDTDPVSLAHSRLYSFLDDWFIIRYERLNDEALLEALDASDTDDVIREAFALLFQAMRDEEAEDWPSFGGPGGATASMPTTPSRH